MPKKSIFVINPCAMDILDFREYVLGLPEVEECTPFDDVTLVYKVGGRMFACTNMEEFTGISFHHDVEQGEALRERYSDVVPAWHFNKKYWSTVRVYGDVPDKAVREMIYGSYIFTIHHNVTPKAERLRLLALAQEFDIEK